jgi:ribosomal protein S18 acetylase RimI-like enzyme
MLSPERLDTYMRRAAMLSREVVGVPPFVCLFNRDDALRFFNYARPLAPVGADPAALAGPLAALRSAFRARGRLPRFEFVEETAPELGAALVAAGFALEARNPLLVCTAETLRPAPAIPGLAITALTPDSSDADILAFMSVQQQGFGEHGGEPPTLEEVERQRPELAREGAFLARLDGTPVSAGAFTPPLDGLTELAGIATLEAYRRRGLAAAVTAAAAAAAFARGVEIAFLTAGDERAGRVYERVGFRLYATAVAYCEE